MNVGPTLVKTPAIGWRPGLLATGWLAALMVALPACEPDAGPTKSVAAMAQPKANHPSQRLGSTTIPASPELPPTLPRGVAGDPPSRWALNALVFPVFDDDEPPRWADPQITADCDPATRVSVNGRPIVVGERVPANGFELRWQAVACQPFGPEGPMLGGEATLFVWRVAGRAWHARVETRDMHWSGPWGRQAWPTSFESTSPDGPPPRHSPQTGIRLSAR